MRDLFLSERRYIRNVLARHVGIGVEINGPVLFEYYSPPRLRSRVSFNSDFCLQFVADQELNELKSYCAPVLTNTLGVDVFVSVNKCTSRPVLTELLGGEGFEMKYFQEHIDKVEASLSQLGVPIAFRTCVYCRVFVIENDICFLAFPDMSEPAMRGTKQILKLDDECSIASYVEGNDLVCVDGWIKTSVAESEAKLEAIYVNANDN